MIFRHVILASRLMIAEEKGGRGDEYKIQERSKAGISRRVTAASRHRALELRKIRGERQISRASTEIAANYAQVVVAEPRFGRTSLW